MTGNCLNCGAPLPKNARSTRKFCDNGGKCKQQYHRQSHDPTIRENHKVPPATSTGDPELDRLCRLPYEASIRVKIIGEYFEKQKEKWQQQSLEDAEKIREEMILDPSTAKEVARILAQKYDPSRTGQS